MAEPEPARNELPDRMFMCTICGWLYEADRGVPEEDIPPRTRWEDVLEDFVCTECGAGKDWFQELRIGDLALMDDRGSMQDGPELVLTMNAVERLRSLLEESGDTHCKLRIEADGPADNPEYIFSFEESGDSNDIELDYARIAVLVDPESHRRLRGREIDHRQNDNGEHFVVRLAE